MADPGSQDEFSIRAGGDPSGGDKLNRINSFSLVSYIPGPLGDFLTDVRAQLVCGCTARSHATILPPRAIKGTASEALSYLRQRVPVFPPFTIEMPRLRIFEETGVIFADIGSGRDQMLDMHDSLATGPLEFVEPWDYYPHITLVQGIPPEQVIPAYQRTLEIWNSLPFGKSFHVDTLTFVQATLENCWLDLAELELRGAVQLSTR